MIVEESEDNSNRLTGEELKILRESLNTDEDFIAFAKNISMLFRGMEGQDVESNSIIQQLIDIKDIRERSRYPTYSIVSLIVYLNIISKENVNAKVCKLWADTLSHALISYKGEGRKEAIEMRRSTQSANQEFYLGPTKYSDQTQPIKKAHFWSKAPKQGGSEFKE